MMIRSQKSQKERKKNDTLTEAKKEKKGLPD